MFKKILPWHVAYLEHIDPSNATLGWHGLNKVFKKTDFTSRRAKDFLAGWNAAWVLANKRIDDLLEELAQNRSENV
jgi:hypothetical protein